MSLIVCLCYGDRFTLLPDRYTGVRLDGSLLIKHLPLQPPTWLERDVTNPICRLSKLTSQEPDTGEGHDQSFEYCCPFHFSSTQDTFANEVF
jgi:hypothetical protein